MQHWAVEFACEHALERLHLGAQGAGEAEPLGDHLSDDLGSRRDQPHLVALGEVLTRERDGLRPEVGQDVLLVDVVGEHDEGLFGVTADQAERSLLGVRQVLPVLADGKESELVPGEHRNVAERDQPATPRLATHVEDARATHERVVDVEEGHDGPRGRGAPRCIRHRD